VCARGPGFKGCGKIRALAEPVEDLVAQALIARLDTPALAVALDAHSTGDNDVDAALEAVDARFLELGEMWAAGEIDRAGWTAARRRLEAQREELTATARRTIVTAVLEPYSSQAGALRHAWPSLEFGRRRAILDAVVESVTIGPAVKGRNYFDQERVSVRWRA
jgi:hypothetical protein